MPSMLRSSLVALTSAASVAAHGFVKGVSIDGQYQTGWLLDYAYNPSPPQSFGWSETALDLGFVSPAAVGDPDIICHLGAKNGALSATVAAGTTMEVFWNTWPDSHKGPVIDYLASCKGDCATVDKTTLEFFKIAEKGLEGGVWATDELLANNFTWSVTIPATIAPGNYVLRHEMIALHGAGSPNGAQLYPFCINLDITGTGTEAPAGTLGTALYKADDPGILVSPFSEGFNYIVPGPPVYSSGYASDPAAPAAPGGAAGPASPASPASPAYPADPAPRPDSGNTTAPVDAPAAAPVAPPAAQNPAAPATAPGAGYEYQDEC